jgi:ABC-2 type transport system ATP-binding protein
MAGRRVTVFVTTHYMDEAEYCDRLALIDEGRIIALGTPEELRTRHMPEAVWELEADRLVEALNALKSAIGAVGESPVREVAVFGNTLHVLGKREEDPSSLIHSTLAEKGIITRRLERIEPSLEDVFVSLVESKDREQIRGSSGNDQ